MRKQKSRVSLKQHLLQPFSIPYPGRDRSYLSSGFCESDESTTIFKRTVVEGDSDVCAVDCSICGGPVITQKHSSELSSTFSPEIVGCLIQKDKTLSFVVETSLSQYDFETVKGVILNHLQRHDFSASFHRINVYHSGVSSLLRTKLPPKRSLLFSLKLKSTTEEQKEKQKEQESNDQGQKNAQDKESRLRQKELAKSASKLLKELQKLSTSPAQEKEKTSSSPILNLQKTSKNSQKKLSKAEEIFFHKQTQKFLMNHSEYD